MKMIDIQSNHKKIIQNILIRYIPNYEIWVFGSRITGNKKKYSDLDLVIISEKTIPTPTLAQLKYDLSDSNLPFKVDILEWACLPDNFRKIIKEKHEIFS